MPSIDVATLAVYAVPLLGIYAWYLARRRGIERRSRAAHEDSVAAGLVEPPSLHPAIDPLKCIGCGTCVKACPEQPEHQVLGIIEGKAHLVSPSDCIGHGACRTACPVGAISLVFGTATRGVEIPMLSRDFESNVPGLFIAGELGGMGLIRNALAQGRQAVEAVQRLRPRRPDVLDLLIVGAGPAGFAASLTAKSLGLRYLTVEQESLGGCVFQYPRAKLVMTSPVDLPIVGRLRFTQTSKESLLGEWQRMERAADLGIRYHERVLSVARETDAFTVQTASGTYRAATVLLAIGRRGTPRQLGVPGEELPKVVYRLIEPEQYAGQRVLVVGGGDSALEAAASIAEATDAQVTLSYRGDAFTRAKAKNRARVEQAVASRRLRLALGSEVRRIDRERVLIDALGRPVELPNDAVIVNAGGVLPTQFLRDIGVDVETRFGTA